MKFLKSPRGVQGKLKGFFGLFLSVFMVISAFPAFAVSYADVVANQVPRVLGDSVYPTGSLVNDSGTIYVISQGVKIPITNWQAFVGLGYSSKNIVKGNLSSFTSAQSYFLTSASMAHPWGTYVSYKSTIYYSTQAGLIPVPSSEVFINNGGISKLVVKANSKDLAGQNSAIPALADNDSRILVQPAPAPQLSFGTPAMSFGSGQQVDTGGNAFSFGNVIQSTGTSPSLQNPSAPQITVPTSVIVGTPVTVSASSTDPSGLNLSYVFTWGDGSPPTTASTSNNSATHTYLLDGIYTLTVTVTDILGYTNYNNTIVTVSVPPPTQ